MANRRTRRWHVTWLISLLACLGAAMGSLPADAQQPPDQEQGRDSQPGPPEPKTTAAGDDYDPFAEAFAIPEGIELTDEQQQRLDAMKAHWQPRFDKAMRIYEEGVQRLQGRLEGKWKQELYEELGGRKATLEEVTEIDNQLERRRQRFIGYHRVPLTKLQVLVRPQVHALITNQQWAAARRISDERTDALLAECEEFQATFRLPPEIELTPAQKDRLERLKQQWRSRFAQAEKERQARLAALNDDDLLDHWREDIRLELRRPSDLSDDRLQQEIDSELKERLKRYRVSAGQRLTRLMVQAQPSVWQIVTPRQWAGYYKMDAQKQQRLLSESDAYRRAFRLPEGVGLSKKQQRKLKKLKKEWAPRFAREEATFQGRMSEIDRQRIRQWRAELLADLRGNGMSDEQIEQAVELEVQSRRQDWKDLLHRPSIKLLVRVQPLIRQILTPDQLAQVREAKFGQAAQLPLEGAPPEPPAEQTLETGPSE